MRYKSLLALIVLMLMVAVACRSEVTGPDTGPDLRPDTGPDTGGEKNTGWLDGSPAGADRDADGLVEGEAGEMLVSADSVEVVREVEAPAEPMEESAGSAPAAEMAQQSHLTAGEVDDNARWDDYLLYLRDYVGPTVIKADVSQRHQIWVTDSDGRPALGALVEISAAGQEVARLRTHSDGRVYFFPRAYGDTSQEMAYDVQVTVGSETAELTIPAGASQREWQVVLPAAGRTSDNVRLDVLFLIDATGSMADEIAQLKDNIQAIAAAIDSMPARPDLRLAMTVYRDQGDAYVSRTFEFTPDVDAFEEALAEVRADGGGDYPEDLNEALSRAVHAPEWRVEETVSLIFLVADAPPHLDYGQQNHYAFEMLAAAERGIKIYPIASSGLDEQGEYIFRQLAQVTGGRFIFLTYGPEGPGTPGEETTFNVDQYTVSALDDLVVKIVEEELAYQSGDQE
ncbi:MAG: VWA domain-containing protein [Chloroflexota bacterium]